MIKNKISKIDWQRLRDVRFLGFSVFMIIVFLTTWSGVNIIQTNYRLQQEIAELDQRNQLAQLENANLKLETDYYNSDTYLELTARQQFGKAAPGEKLILVPKHVALKHVPEIKFDEPKMSLEEPDKRPSYQKNLKAWLDFFLHRQL